MNILPLDILFEILTKMSPEEAIQACRTNKVFSQVCSMQSFWESMYRIKFPYRKDVVENWREAYKEELKRRRDIRDMLFQIYSGDFLETGPLLATIDAIQFLYELPPSASSFMLSNMSYIPPILSSFFLKIHVSKGKYNIGYAEKAIEIAEGKGLKFMLDNIVLLSRGHEEYYYAPDKKITLDINMETTDAILYSKEYRKFLGQWNLRSLPELQLLNDALAKIPEPSISAIIQDLKREKQQIEKSLPEIEHMKELFIRG